MATCPTCAVSQFRPLPTPYLHPRLRLIDAVSTPLSIVTGIYAAHTIDSLPQGYPLRAARCFFCFFRVCEAFLLLVLATWLVDGASARIPIDNASVLDRRCIWHTERFRGVVLGPAAVAVVVVIVIVPTNRHDMVSSLPASHRFVDCPVGYGDWAAAELQRDLFCELQRPPEVRRRRCDVDLGRRRQHQQQHHHEQQ